MFDENVSCRDRVRLGDRMLYLRQSMNITYEAFAKRLCCNTHDIREVENGDKSWSKAMIKLISYEFGVSMKWLLIGVPEDNDKEFIKKYNDINYSLLQTQELIYNDFLEDHHDMFTDNEEAKQEYLESKFDRLAPFCEATLLSNQLDDYGVACFDEGFNKGYKYAVAFVRGMLGLEGIPDKPDASTVIITKKRK